MAKKSKKNIKNTENKPLWLIFSLCSGILLFFTIFRMGPLGIFLNNLLTYLLGSLYFIPILSFFCVGLYKVFAKKNRITDKTSSGIIVSDFFVVLLSAYISQECLNYEEYLNYVKEKFLLVKDGEFVFSGGVLGNLIYVFFTKMATRNGTLVILIVLALLSLILLIPANVYRQLFNDSKKKISESNASHKKKKEEERIALQREKEEKRARLAEQMAELARQEEEMKARQEKERKIAEIKEKEEAEKRAKKAERDRILSKSPVFINLNEDEIYDKKKQDNKEENESLNIPTEKKEPQVLKIKRTSGTYRLPKPYENFLDKAVSSSSNINKTSAAVKGEKVIEILHNFGIEASLLNTYIGPSVTKFEIKPDSSVKVNRIMNISDNIKMELAAKDIRIEAPIPGRSAVGIEIPNVEPVPVRMLDLIRSIPENKKNVELLFSAGKDLMGKAVFCDLAKMPHLLIAGATGSGKSVCINSIIVSFLLRTNPNDVKLVLVDPKKVEFTPYKDIPHLLWPIIDDSQMASNMLKKIVVIMEERYEAFASAGVRNIDGFNAFVKEHNRNLKAGESPMNPLPYIVVIIDELADLMAIAGKDVELSIQRITQLARASGIHLIVATQRPSTDVITGLIKSNIPSRISFAVASSIDSRTILDQTGAERLLGNGDMLYYPQGETSPIRLQGVYVTDREINRITAYVKSQAKPEYEDSYFEFLSNMNGTTVMAAGSVNADSQDSLYDEVVEFVRAQQKASTSLLQRRFGIGYNRAARLIDTLEDRGIIGPANGSKPREVYVKEEEEE